MTSATKFALGAAALAMVGAAAITPGVAQAADETCLPGQTLECAATTNFNLAALALEDTPTNPLIQNDIIWFGAPNASFWNDADTVQVWTFSPLTVLPFLEGTAIETWFNGQSSQSCFIGITTTLGGPYAEPGQYKHAYNRKGCNVGWTV